MNRTTATLDDPQETWRTTRAGADPVLADELLTVHDAARFLNVTVSWIYEHVRDDIDDRLPVVKLGKYLRFDRRDLRCYIDAKREPNSYRHSYTETYSYSESSSVRSASAHTAAETVAIFTRATFSRSATCDKRSVLTAFAPARARGHLALPRSRSRTSMSCVGAVAKKSRNSVDTLLPIQVKGCSTSATWGK